MYRYIIRPILFILPPETAHNFAALFLRILGLPVLRSVVKLVFSSRSIKKVSIMGLEFPSRIGLAAGFDKNAVLYKSLSNFGFGFVEIGTVTPLPQSGNDKPRMFRLPKDRALINRMGFNNDGVTAVAERLKSRPKNVIVGGNIGKNKLTPNEDALSDYIICFKALHDYVDYFVVNVSSPNTPGLRELQGKEALLNILQSLQDLNKAKSNSKPILLKIAPDLNNNQLDDIIEIVKQSQITGIIATNTTIDRSGLSTSNELISSAGAGGLSGMPLKNRSVEVVSYLAEKSQKSFVIIGVGGIMNARDAVEFIDAGADLVQVYTGFIYEGPTMIKKIDKLLKLKT